MTNQTKILLVGSGPMAIEYAKIMQAREIPFEVIGRGEASASQFTETTGVPVATGGLDAWLERSAGAVPSRAIVAVSENGVGEAARALIAHGVHELLVEKPGGRDAQDIRAVQLAAREAGARVFIGYNRRFYASTAAARKIIETDGGVTSFNFEFTEWGHVIEGLVKEPGVKEEWFLSNSTHVIDLAFFLGGEPAALSAFAAGALPWHPRGAAFAGAGKTNAGALFSYQANWAAPGRWAVEVLTRAHRLIFRPLEKLQVQKIGSVAVEFAEIDDSLDQAFKPGLAAQFDTFVGQDQAALPTIDDQVRMLDWYLRMRGDV